MTSCREVDDVIAIANQYMARMFSDNCQTDTFLKYMTCQILSDILDRKDVQVTTESEVCIK